MTELAWDSLVALSLVDVAPYAVEAVVDAVERILSSSDAKYRRLNTSSRSFLERFEGARGCLEALGFCEDVEGCLVLDGSEASRRRLEAALPLLRSRVETPPAGAAPVEDAPPQKLPDELLLRLIVPFLVGSNEVARDRFADGTVVLGSRHVVRADSTSRGWYRAFAPHWDGRRREACLRLGARARLDRVWRTLHSFGSRTLKRDLRRPASVDTLTQLERALRGPLPLELRLSILHHHDGQSAGTFYADARLFTCQEIATFAVAGNNWLPIAERKGCTQLAIHRRTGHVALLAALNVGRKLAPSWGQFLRLV